jgi:hypothetical protein
MKNQALKVIDQVDELIKDKKIFDIFPNSSLEIIRPALIDAFMLGFSLDDFAKKDIYILEGSLTSRYNIVVSVDYCRKMALAWGLVEIGQPLYEYNSNKELEACSIKIKRRVGGEILTITSRVFFSDYNKGTGLWLSKPFIMLAKVCEVSAYRKAFPELLSKIYIEEEFEKELGNIDKVAEYKETLSNAGSLSELKYIWSKLPHSIRKDKNFIELKNNLKQKYDQRN